ncbi:unnamed protein product [Coffea canephora]|uniref:Flavin-containing monooxygenase n=1 Tax=Coffea canephora TaxID=49390 RepID=A0A068V527_COFCA|nr:unnamed protein product [Coffea canephora]
MALSGGGDRSWCFRPWNGKGIQYPDHEEVLKFLNRFARGFGLNELIQLNAEVIRVEQKDNEWMIESKTSDDQLNEEELFDAVVVCNGHYTQPKLANSPGIKKWPGKQIHSHTTIEFLSLTEIRY